MSHVMVSSVGLPILIEGNCFVPSQSIGNLIIKLGHLLELILVGPPNAPVTNHGESNWIFIVVGPPNVIAIDYSEPSQSESNQ
jgi:hypothetical protein